MNISKAHNAVSLALHDGSLVKQPCIRCGRLPAVAHHDDYSKPLDVIWLCRKHHTELHFERGDNMRGKHNNPRMQRTTVTVAPPQMSWLKREAKRLGVTIGELLRRIIDQVRKQPAKESHR